MKKLFLLSVAVMAFLFISLSASAENSTGNVYSDVYQSDSVIVVRLVWLENDSPNFIQPFISWDTTYKPLSDTGSYSNIDYSSWGMKYYSKEGFVEFLIPAKKSCKEFFVKISFIDGISQKRNNFYSMVVTEGFSAPVMINSTVIPNFSSALIGATLENTCNSLWGQADVFISQTSTKIASISTVGYSDHVELYVYDLIPNQEYYVRMTIYNGHGNVSFTQSFRTMSNLPPSIESLRSTVLSPSVAEVTSYVDTKNTNSMIRNEYGEHIELENLSDWSSFYGEGNYTSRMYNLKPSTVYFWRHVAKNQFDKDEGQIKMFKTNEFATAVTEITADDLLQISSCPAGVRIFAEKDAVVEIYSITGQKVLVANVNGGEAQIFSSLTPGLYIVKSFIEGYTVTKKAMVN